MRSGARMVVSIHRSGNLHALDVVRNYLCGPQKTTGPAMIPNHCQKFSAELDVAQGLTVTALRGQCGRALYGQVSGRVTGQVGGAGEPEQPAASTGRLTSMEGCIEAPPKKGEINLKVGRVTLMCITEEALVSLFISITILT